MHKKFAKKRSFAGSTQAVFTATTDGMVGRQIGAHRFQPITRYMVRRPVGSVTDMGTPNRTSLGGKIMGLADEQSILALSTFRLPIISH